MPDVTLTAEKRTQRGSRPSGRLRREGLLPAVVYGLDEDSLVVTVPARELGHILSGDSGANTLITLAVDGEEEQLTLARQIQRDPVRGDLVHVDFVRIRRDVAVEAEIPVHVVGEAPGTKEGGIVEQLLFNLTISAKPADIPNEIEIDVSGLELNDQLRFTDIALPPGVTAEYEDDELLVQVIIPRVVEEPEPEEGEEIEGEEGEEIEGEEGEGEEPTEASDAESDDAGD
ncbi:MAG: 50S ribosomal protein L25 [Acidimicrobiia bacterium]|nr:50S ribosomal protein L25 [Acidimicrobiia bacterium]